MSSSHNFLKLAVAGVMVTLTATTQAETFFQTTFNPATSTWNTPLIWGNNDVTAGNDYQTVAGPTRLETTFTINFGGVSTPWEVYAQVRDNGGTGLPSGDSFFNGDNLLIGSLTRFLSKARNTTSTANFVLQDGGMMFLAPGGAAGDGPGTATWAGTISTVGNTLIGLGAVPATDVTTLNVVAPISGSGTLTLTGKGSMAGFLNLLGDISGFTGTFLLTPAADKTNSALSYSIANSATFATLQLDYQSPFFVYDLSTYNVSFGSVILGTDTVLGAGTYDAAALNALTGDLNIFVGTGSITVAAVPEPSTYALGLLGLLAVAVATRRRALAVRLTPVRCKISR